MNAPVRRFLVVDDEVAICTIVSRAITPLGLTPTLAYDGAQAIAAAQAHAHELHGALIDVMMPVMNGIEAAEAIHKLLPDLPIILMTGSVPPQLLSRLHQLPVAAFLTKPFTIAVLRALLIQLGIAGGTP